MMAARSPARVRSVCAKSVELAANALKDRLLAAAARLFDRPVADGTLIDGRAVFGDQSISLCGALPANPAGRPEIQRQAQGVCHADYPGIPGSGLSCRRE